MKGLARLLVAALIRNRDLSLPEEKYRVGVLEGWLSIAGNLVLALLKGIFGFLTGSVALLADAVHTASDISSSLAVLVGFSLSRKKPDQEHPFGHGRMEYFSGLIIALMLVGAGVAFIITAFERLQTGSQIVPGAGAIIVVAFSVLFKELMYQFSYQLGKLIDSEALIGDAWHHRTDALSSVVVLISLGGSYYNVEWLDPVVAFGISAFVIYAGLQIARSSISRLLGAAPPPEVKEDIISCAREIDGVIGAHDLEVHDYGYMKSMTLHIEVEGTLSVNKAHDIAVRVEKHISKTYSCSAVVHLDPRTDK